MRRSALAVAALFVATLASLLMAEDAKKTAPVQGEKPKPSPGWVVIEEDWWYPHSYDFLDSLHRARVHYRAREEKAASAEIDKAVTWLDYAHAHAEKTTAEDLMMARADLMDFSGKLKEGVPIKARDLDAAFAHASAALAKHHHFKASEALAKEDLKVAGRHLMSAVEYLRAAANSANREYGSEIVGIYDDYAPFGYWDESVVLAKNKLEANLTTVKAELEKLAKELKASK